MLLLPCNTSSLGCRKRQGVVFNQHSPNYP
uniref:Uncharacterized protein n=1 Tax=Rhizophora mucronata TaxID=61149 RepID=A0A2P2PTH7_RHIMU